jgi:mannitol operon transcriptional antiterminator
MNISSRQRFILDILLRESNGITVGKIADEVGVSSRTIHRELDAIERFLKDYGLYLVKKAGIGVQIQGDPLKKEEISMYLLNVPAKEYSPAERKVLILCTLLESTEPVKLISLAYDLKVTTATISNDLDQIENWLGQYGLSLIRKRGYGIEITGPEAAKRKVMRNLISENLDETELIGVIKENIQNKTFRNINSVSERLLGLIEKEKLVLVESAIRDLEKELHSPIADSAYLGLVVHLALAIERIVKGEKIVFDRNYLKELENTHEYHIAKKIVERLKKLFNLEIPVAEIGYITMHLKGAKLRNSQEDWLPSNNIELMTVIQKMIQSFEEKMGVKLSNDRSLFHGLLTHLEPAIYRMKGKMEIRNPLLSQIKNNYPDIFEIVKEVTHEVFPNLQVPEEEIGYLVMHFGSSLERALKDDYTFRALIVCSSGIGSSKMLASRIKKEIPEIEILKNASLFEVDSIPENEYDFIISTISLPMASHECIVVSPFLTEEEIQRIRAFVNRFKIPARGSLFQNVKSEDILQKLKSHQSYINYAVDILDGFYISEVGNKTDEVSDAIHLICDRLERNGVLKNCERVAEQLLQREKLAGLGIPDTDLALFHTRSEEILKPSFTVHSLSHPLFIRSMENQPMEIKKVLLLLGPKEIEKEGLEVLSEISSLLLEEETIDVLHAEDKSMIQTYFAEKLHGFIDHKMKRRDTK